MKNKFVKEKLRQNFWFCFLIKNIIFKRNVEEKNLKKIFVRGFYPRFINVDVHKNKSLSEVEMYNVSEGIGLE